MTVTLAAPKLPLVLPPGEAYAGDVVIADIGIPHEVIDGLEGPHIELLTPEQMRELVEPRAADSHKGDFGRVTIVAGSRARPGAAYLVGDGRAAVGRRARHRRDAGVVPADRRVDGPGVHDRAACRSRDGIVTPAALDRVLELRPRRHRVRARPRARRRRRASSCAALLERATVPLVLDADALTVLADDPGRLVGREERDVIITPHPGEMARLIGSSIEEVQANRIEVATDFATTHRVYVVLKGHRTIIATPEGHVFINPDRQSRDGHRRHRRRADRA